MREIKFRAWDKKDKMWLDDEFYIGQYGDVHGVIGNYFPRGIEPLDDVVLMQFTGLTDKNGVEIYEGDIISFKRYDESSFFGGESIINREVKWDTYYGAGWNFGISHKDGEKRWSYPFPDDCEVIGNIYENPELLNKEVV